MQNNGAPKLDALDVEILNIYQHDTRITSHVIGEKIGLSPAAVQRRLKYLREQGIIEQEVAKISPKLVGFQMTCIVNVKLKMVGYIDYFKTKLKHNPNVQQCYHVTGDEDFVIIVIARDMEDYDRITHTLLLNDDHVQGFTTRVVYDRAKVGVSVPITG